MYEMVERYGFVASHQIHGLPDAHPCSGVHSHRWVAEVILVFPRPMAADSRTEPVVLEPLRRHCVKELDGKHLNDVLFGAPTPARLASHVAVWCLENLGPAAALALSAVIVSSDVNSRVRYTIPRTRGNRC